MRAVRLYRPHIPLKVRCLVAMRQLGELWPDAALEANKGELGAFRDRLLKKLSKLLGEEKLHLDHDPPLAARERKGEGKKTVYKPDANDPNYLLYRGKHAHHIKTQVKGDGAQYPDRVLIKRERRRRESKKHPLEIVAGFQKRINKSKPKAKLRGRSFQQLRCVKGAACHCDRQRRDRCGNYRENRR